MGKGGGYKKSEACATPLTDERFKTPDNAERDRHSKSFLRCFRRPNYLVSRRR